MKMICDSLEVSLENTAKQPYNHNRRDEASKKCPGENDIQEAESKETENTGHQADL